MDICMNLEAELPPSSRKEWFDLGKEVKVDVPGESN